MFILYPRRLPLILRYNFENPIVNVKHAIRSIEFILTLFLLTEIDFEIYESFVSGCIEDASSRVRMYT